MISKLADPIKTANSIPAQIQKQKPDFISYDAPPLDFSYKNIKHLSELRELQPRQGEKCTQPQEQAKLKVKKEEKQERERGGEEAEDQHRGEKKKNQIIRLLPQNNVNSAVSTIVSSSAMKNISLKAKEQLQKKKKKFIQVKLVCVSLMLSYNKIRQLTGLQTILQSIMHSPAQLQWIDLSHNYITVLDYDFAHFPDLKTFYLHCNFISDLAQLQKIQHLQNLKTMTIHGNPLAAVANFRVLTISILPNLKKLDSVLISKKERDNAGFIRSQTKKYPLPKIITLPPQEKKQEDEEEKE